MPDTTLHDLIATDADWLDASAAQDEARADELLERAARKRTLSAQYRRLAAQSAPPSAFEAQVGSPSGPVAAEPQHPADPDPDLSRHNPTWQIPQREAAPCGCQFWRGESCELCDKLVPAQVSVTAPWSPPVEASPSPLVNGWTR